MKKLIFFVLVILLAFQACKKSPALPTTQQMIQNKWNVKSVSAVTHKAGTEDQVKNTTGGANDYFDFRNDGKLYVSLNNGRNKDTSNYVLINDSQFSINGSTLANITTLNSNNLVFNIKTNTNTSDYEQDTFTLTR